MSLDISLIETIPTEVYEAGITHNLGKMAAEAGIYEYLWHPEEVGITAAKHLIPLLEAGLKLLLSDPDRFRQFNPENGWGTYEGLVNFTAKYLDACLTHPDAEIRVSR